MDAILAIDDLAAVLMDVPAQLRAVAGRADERVTSRWTRSEVLGHCIDSALNNLQRFTRLRLADQVRFPEYTPDGWVTVGDYRARPWDQLVTEWELLNRHVLHVLRGVRSAEFDHIWADTGHSLAWLAVDYVRHLRHHLGQAIGPAT